MKAYIHKLYDEILCKEQSNDIIISGASSLKVIILIVSKLLNQILITITSIFKENPDISSKTVCIVLTQNQMRSVSPLVDDSIAVIRPRLDSANISNSRIFYFPALVYFWDFIFQVSYIIKRSNTSWKQIYNAAAYYYYYKSFKRYFSKNRPKSVVITNPSHPILRSSVLAAHDLKIPTVYLPHASASPLYPTIKTDYALLEGTDALHLYRFADFTKKILLGSPRLDPYIKMKRIEHQGINILVAPNLLDEIEKVYELFCLLKNNDSTKHCRFLFRPHPNLSVDCDKFAKLGIEVISPKQESCLESLERTDVLISANSTIFFEAIYLPIRCYYYDFVKDGLVKDSYNLKSYKFVNYLSIDVKIDTTPFYIDKEEADRIDINMQSKQVSSDLIVKFLNNTIQ